MSKSRYFAMYLQATHGTEGERRQWIVLPVLAGQASRLFFTRSQDNANHRSRWRWDFTTNEVFGPETLQRWEQSGWKFDPPVVAAVPEEMLKFLVANPRTPYSLLNTFTKNAAKKGYKV